MAKVKVSESSAVEHIAQVARELDYDVEVEPGRIPGQKFWPPFRRALSRITYDRVRPDLYVQHRGKAVSVVAEERPVLLGDVFLASKERGYDHHGAILCVADDSFPKIPESVKELADRADVRLCPLSAVGEALREMLE